MGNCVGHTGRKNGNENVRDAKSKQGNTEFVETTLSDKSQETNQEKLSSGVTALKSKNRNRNKKSEQQNRKTFEDTERVVEQIKEEASEPVAHHTRNQGAPQEDKIKKNLKTNSGKKHRTSNATDSNTKYQEDSLTAETSNVIQEQSLTERQREISKCCDESDVENTKECLDFNTKMVGEKRSSFLEHTDRTKCSTDSVNITDSMKKSSTICTKRFIESDENAGSFEKLVVSACFSENVRKAFVALSEDFVNPQENVNNMGTEITNEGEKLKEESRIVSGCFPEDERTYEDRYCKEYIAPHKDVKCANSNMDVGPEGTDKKQPLQERLSTFAECYPQNVGTNLNRESTDLIDDIDPQEKVGKIFATDDNDLVVVKDLNFSGHTHNEESTLTQCLRENEKTDGNKYSKAVIDPAGNIEIPLTKTNNDLDPVKNITEDEQAFNNESVCTGRVPDNKGKNFDPDSTDLGMNNESTKMENELANGKHSTGSINIEESLECLSITNENEMNMLRNVPVKEQPLNEESIFNVCCSVREQISSTIENELDVVQNVQHKEQSLNEDLVFTEYCSEKEEAGFCKHNSDLIGFENNLNEMASDVLDKKQSLNKNSNFPESSLAERDDTSFCKDSSYFIDPEDNQVSSPSRHENVLDEAVYDKVQSPAMDDIGFSKESTDFTGPESNLVSSSTANTNELNIHKDNHDKGETLNENPVSDGCFSGMSTGFTKEGKDTIDLEVNSVKSSFINEDGLDTDKYVPDKRLPLNDDSGFTECCLENEETGFSKHSTNSIDLPENLVISCSTQENGLNIDKKFWDEGTEMVMITDKDCAPEHMFVIDQENEYLILDGDEDSAFTGCFPGNETTEKEARNGDMNENFKPEHEIESVEESTLYETGSLSTRNENELNRDEDVPDIEKHLSEDSTFPGNCSEDKSIKMQETNENTYENQKNKATKECLFDICKERDLYETGIFNSDKRNDESLSDICEDSGLYEIVSLSTEDENEFCLDKDCRNKGLLMNEDSAYSGCCLEHGGREMQETNQDKSSNLGEETASALKNVFHFCEESPSSDPGNLNADEKSDVCTCLPDVCEDSPLYETLSYCKIDREESCDCFEDMDCCCQCCECIGNRD